MSDPSEINRRLYRAGQVRELDRLAVDVHHIAGAELMERAGRVAWELLQKTWPQAKKILIVCGAGNNAGDGYVIARLALENGRDVDVLALVEPASLHGDALTAAKKFIDSGQTVLTLPSADFGSAEVIVDAILGTGLDREVADDYLDAINRINNSDRPVLAVDIPSGLNADTGKAMTIAVQADQTISFIGRKQGLYTADGIQHRGILHFADLAVPATVLEQVQAYSRLIALESFQHLLVRRRRSAHKGNFGHVLVVGGDYGYAGAVQMSAIAAARTGAGLTTVATRPEHALMLPLARPELMTIGVHAAGDLIQSLDKANVVAIGPGIGQSDWSNALFAKVLDSKLPLVVDADGLNLLAQEPFRRDNWVLTPHPGEAARLLATTVAEIEADRFAATVELQQRYGGVVILKGAGTIVVGKTAMASVCVDGNPGMASGGFGDVLTGLISGLLAQDITNEDAAGLGVCIHARAADLIAADQGERGMLATDLLPLIQRLINI